jgi:hypothetical protein
MKHFYLRQLIPVTLLLLGLLAGRSSFGQCPGGYVPSGVAFDTTISFSSGNHNSTIKFPKFDPTTGMVTCAKITMEITSTLNLMRIENEDNTTTSASVTFIRSDTMKGPGLTSSGMGNSETQSFGPYSLAPTDNVFGSGPDYIAIGPANIFNTVKSVTITDLGDLMQFYGPPGDSLAYTYTAFGQTQPNITGNWSGGINASGSVHYKIEFCYCPSGTLPLNVYSFNVRKTTTGKAELKWTGTVEPGEEFYYVAEVSRNAYDYTQIGILQKNDNISGEYKMNFSALQGESGNYYFRVKQVYNNGYVRYSTTRQLVLESFEKNPFSVYPNPSNGIVGIKFDNISAEEFAVQIFTTQGQTIVNKDLVVNGSSYVQLTSTLKPGVYWVRVTNKKSQALSVQQILIK